MDGATDPSTSHQQDWERYLSSPELHTGSHWLLEMFWNQTLRENET